MKDGKTKRQKDGKRKDLGTEDLVTVEVRSEG